MKVLIATQYAERRSNSTGYLWEILIKQISREHKIEILSFDKEKIEMKNVIHRTLRLPENFLFLKSRVINSILVSFLLFLEIFRFKLNAGTRFMILGTNPALLIMFLPIIKLLNPRVKFIMLIHDLHPFSAFQVGFVKSIIVRRVIYFLYVCGYRRVDKFLVIGRDMKERVQLMCPGIPIIYVPNWFEKTIDRSNRAQSCISGPPNYDNSIEKVRFLFFGNMGKLQGIKVLLESIEKLKSDHAEFTFIGSGSEVELVLEHSKRDTRIHYNGSIPFDLRHAISNKYDVSIVSLAQGLKGTCVPSKFYYSISMNMPVFAIVDADSEIALTMKEHKLGWCETSYNACKIAAALQASIDCETRDQLNTQLIFENFFSSQFSMKQINKLLFNV